MPLQVFKKAREDRVWKKKKKQIIFLNMANFIIDLKVYKNGPYKEKNKKKSEHNNLRKIKSLYKCSLRTENISGGLTTYATYSSLYNNYMHLHLRNRIKTVQ